MADLSTMRTPAIEALVTASPASHLAALTALPPRTRFSFRGRPAAVTAFGTVLGFDLPQVACRFAEDGARRALWLGPDEWLVTLPDREATAFAGAAATALAGLPSSLVDVSQRSLALAVSGPMAARIINAGCPLDLSPDAFPVGMCTRTLLGKAEIVLSRTDEARFEIDVWRSFADYVWRLLEEARREFV
ncbi:sarcosine oxidase subunit gamma [Methylobrevis pamukkalensis]|uniref:Sarcosine oxidase, gamma subunit family n=1 Tax=Methylobrevis pamukkalensis TaxID=1439726 RepID=A0A1E3GZD6_9HYPH|nr:sarcosine oxidase subunit gamma family protein [Methylobrevis pamukkalensis]ODN69413.1 Sarcosine oxidase, gamma subunit family [Methylobrevis pamukkalensis]